VFRGLRGVQPARNRSIVTSWLTLPRLRRLSQTFFLGLFLVLLCKTAYFGSLRPGEFETRLPYPVRIFLEADPFIAVVNALATRALYRGLLWSLAILLPTLFLGRFFCGWICPLGTLNHLVSNVRSERKSGRQRIDSNRYKPWQTLKYYLLFALLAAALLGSALAGILDPIALAVRSFALSILPAWSYALGHGGPLSALLSSKQAYFRQGFLLGAILIVILALNLRVTRLWCRALCPLGALLGLVSRWSILGLEKHQDHCEDCNRCLLHCQGGDDPIPGARWRKAECHLCMNCVADCPESGMRFRFFPRTPTTVEGANLKRRKVLAGLAGGAAALPLLRANTGLSAEPHERLIRPPAALEEKQFLARCIRCGECMKVCPNNALHPALTEAGWEGIWTPVVVPRVGYCEPSCTLCGQVCPTGAIWAFTSNEKAWVGMPSGPGANARPIRLGTAFYDRGRCLPWAMATECIVCEEWCPTSPKAIYLRPAEVTDAAGNTKQVRQPYLDPEHCVGCGACEFACPVRDRPAVYVTSVGESRSKTNQILLRRAAKPISWLPESGDAPGWTKQGDARLFEAADLWKYVDGDAERYLRAGVRRTLTANYRYRETVEAVADVHLMESSDGARSFFESEPSAGSRPAALGDAGRSYGQSVTFRRGPFFVRLVAYQDAPETEPALVSLGQAIERRLVQ
jgi:polyferredoxin